MRIKYKGLKNIVNASGFLLQLGIEHQIESTKSEHPWYIISREHPWKDKETGSGGFIDLLLSRGSGTFMMVVECKRSRDGAWIFLVSEKDPPAVERARCLWVAGTKEGKDLAGWDDINILPSSPESAFCVIRGSGEKGQSLLERLCIKHLLSVDSLANEEIAILKREDPGYHGFYLPVIVTTANLYICKINLSEISIDEGSIDNCNFDPVPMVRFKKTLSISPPPNEKAENLTLAAKSKERTVLIINSNKFIEVLKVMNSRREPFNHYFPWEKALQKNP